MVSNCWNKFLLIVLAERCVSVCVSVCVYAHTHAYSCTRVHLHRYAYLGLRVGR